MKYIDLIAYPIMMAVVYVLLGFFNWDRDPSTWTMDCRAVWIAWGLGWGWALQRRIGWGGYV